MFLEKTKSLRRITAVLHITTEAPARMELARSSEKKKQSLKQHLLEKMKTWINGLLEGERDERKENSEGWIQEKITFDAAYGGERVIAYLFLPHNTPPR